MARSLKKSAKLSLRKVRINSPSIRYKPDSSSIERDQRIEFLGGNGNDDHDDDHHHDGDDDDNAEEFNNNNNGSSESEEFEDKGETFKVAEDEEQHKDDVKRGGDKERIGSEHKLGSEVVDHGGEEKVKKMVVAAAVAEEEKEETEEAGNRVMVVVDKALASTGALEWAITHTLQPQDTLFLLYFSMPYNKGKSKNRKREVKTDELVHTLKKLCQTKRPGIEVEIRRLEGKEKEKGEKIVEEAKKQEVSLLVVGQEKKPPVWRLLKRWAWKRRRGHGGVLKYCLENASCMTIAVKPKNRKLGGYLITTKRHKNFWLLA